MGKPEIHAASIYNVRDFGATGNKAEDARPAVQAAIEACAAAGGGTVYFPPGDYTSGTIHLRSHVRILIDSGATIYSSKDPASFHPRSLFYGEDVHNITLEGRGVVDGQAEYEWRLTDIRDWYIYPNQVRAEKAGLPLVRSFPTSNSIGNLVLLVRCTDVRIAGLSFLHSPSWTMHLWGCERLVIDGVYVYTSLRDGVWADGIDPDGCRDVRITNCTIETGDDALVFYSSSIFGPARPCENITVTNCRLTSSSSALKFCDGNLNAIRNVTIDNCVITGSNRGIAFMVFDGGVLENVVISNVTIETKRYDWFWWGDGDPIHFNLIKRSEIDPNIDKAKEPAAGVIRNVLLRDVLARGVGPCLIHGHVDSPLENITIENLRLEILPDPEAPYHKGEHAITLENARNFRLKDVEIVWRQPAWESWQSALFAQKATELALDGVSARQAQENGSAPAIMLKDVQEASVKNCTAAKGTRTFIEIRGTGTRDVSLWGNDYRHAQQPLKVSEEVEAGEVKEGF